MSARATKDAQLAALREEVKRLNVSAALESARKSRALTAIDDIAEVLWPSGDEDAEWNSDTTSAIAEIVRRAQGGQS